MWGDDVGLFRRGQGRPATPADLRRLRLGDRIEHARETWTIVGRLDFNEVGVRWTELVLDVGSRTWLTVEETEDGPLPEVSWWSGIGSDQVDARAEEIGPGGDQVTSDGTTYLLQHRGAASYLAQGETGTPRAGTVEYADYRSPEHLLLGFENYGTDWHVAAGRLIAPEDLRVDLG